jgi:hypothetical protein
MYKTIRLTILILMIIGLMTPLTTVNVAAKTLSNEPLIYQNAWFWGGEYPNPGPNTPVKLDVHDIRDATPSMYVKSDGTVWKFDGTQISGLQNIISITEGRHCMALDSDGAVWAWGNNKFGQLGNGTASGSDYDYAETPAPVSNLQNVIAISTGVWQGQALKSDGTVWGWGHNAEGELGDGTTIDRLLPVQTNNLTDITAIQCGYSCLALKNDGTVWGWGWNRFGEAGDGSIGMKTNPVQSNIFDVVSLSGGDTSFAVKSDGTVWAWGCNPQGQGDKPLPTQITNISNVKSIKAASSCEQVNAAVIKNDGTVWTWGANHYGQLGDGTYDNRYIPAKAIGLTNVTRLEERGYGYFALAFSNQYYIYGMTDSSGIVNIPAGGNIILLNDQPAQTDVAFPDDPWKVVIASDSDWSDKCDITIGGYTSDTGGYKAGGTVGTLMTFDISPGPFTVKNRQFLGMTITNNDEQDHTCYVNGNSYIIAPPESPPYPVPELSTGILFGLGIVAIGTVINMKKNRVIAS